MISFSLTAQLPSGKGQIRKTWRNGRLVHYPQKRFSEWRQQAAKEILVELKAQQKPIKGPLRMRVWYAPQDKRTRDIPGMADALFHLLEYCGVIEDDGQIDELEWFSGRGLSTEVELY